MHRQLILDPVDVSVRLALRGCRVRARGGQHVRKLGCATHAFLVIVETSVCRENGADIAQWTSRCRV